MPRYVGKFGAKTIEPLATSINACVRGTLPGVYGPFTSINTQ